MNATRRLIVRAAWALPACAVAAPPAAPWPSRPVHLIVVYPPGGVSDAMARTLAEPLAQALGVPVVVENRGGAGGALGMELLARAAPDGCTLAFSAVSPLTLQPLLAGGPRDLLGSVVPVAGVMNTPVLVAGTPAFTGHSFGDLIAQARAHPGELRWATSGIATSGHMVLAQTRLQSGVDITHVPYQGGGPQINDALGGQFEVLSTNVAAAQLQLLAAGRLKALAVGAPTRLDALPQVPTLAELGYPQANIGSLFGLFAPAGTPAAVVARLNAEVGRLLASDAVASRLRESHNLPAGGTQQDFVRQIAAERRRNQELVKRSGGLLS
ncbi:MULTISPECIES: tripartite tricarboxylate transporter substrate binding protein [unclassified Rhizobacter]|uniref:Bug family tripartite tricarboxylate transporter substrate binding protein n=1 Tax=unclassified Rhizobacter TaxID=2640088 RepID=UPI0006F9ED59|nr:MULTISPECIES: tripartite tricarboxylate transporter substrate binding protein [unclassified Rhizobacter]KQU78088.1 ABC transporter substrate-binding protein [Rhizobacter sp. Root29]KQW15834.1 ABC transporter substrate-binding protein [Rhizobacter sp. Root1238]KRB24947.1 ABC transporter substrate-binding protein [Rhizobacter sp. Root16D2]